MAEPDPEQMFCGCALVHRSFPPDCTWHPPGLFPSFAYKHHIAARDAHSKEQLVAALPSDICALNLEKPKRIESKQYTCIIVEWACPQPVARSFADLSKDLAEVLNNHVLTRYGPQSMPVVRDIYISTVFHPKPAGDKPDWEYRKHMSLVQISLDSVAILIDHLDSTRCVYLKDADDYLRLVWHADNMYMLLAEAIASKNEPPQPLNSPSVASAPTRDIFSFTPSEQGAIFALASLQQTHGSPGSNRTIVSSPSVTPPTAPSGPVHFQGESVTQPQPPALTSAAPTPAKPTGTQDPTPSSSTPPERPAVPTSTWPSHTFNLHKNPSQAGQAAVEAARARLHPFNQPFNQAQEASARQNLPWPSLNTSASGGSNLLVRKLCPQYFNQAARFNNAQPASSDLGEAQSAPVAEVTRLSLTDMPHRDSGLLVSKLCPQYFGQASRLNEAAAQSAASTSTPSTAQPAASASIVVPPPVVPQRVDMPQPPQPEPVRTTNPPPARRSSDTSVYIPPPVDIEMYLASMLPPALSKPGSSMRGKRRKQRHGQTKTRPYYQTFTVFDEGVEGENVRYLSPAPVGGALPRHTTPLSVRCVPSSDGFDTGKPESQATRMVENPTGPWLRKRSAEIEWVSSSKKPRLERGGAHGMEDSGMDVDMQTWTGGTESCPVDLTGDD
ncbi:hypothetical protein DACRYDRAFT_114851 [Dacryopinax primogenitus]|uniref:Uncharacterized protein n=1 Tax=Dacryopinax primogenitus (strain DJM 731) TaxID=1858805 RepID=M5G446_DACPD|nr:uncharacterized protein DACRYDRAFT_114851 [Dacryopinax primogenitus]EJU03449.1 hypothetical protein DACRYDRAFT_114851 [Dacryopinax primogenitus]